MFSRAFNANRRNNASKRIVAAASIRDARKKKGKGKRNKEKKERSTKRGYVTLASGINNAHNTFWDFQRVPHYLRCISAVGSFARNKPWISLGSKNCSIESARRPRHLTIIRGWPARFISDLITRKRATVVKDPVVKREIQDVERDTCYVLSRRLLPITFPSSFFFPVALSLLDWARSELQLPFHAADNRQLKLVSRPIFYYVFWESSVLNWTGSSRVVRMLGRREKKKKKVLESRLENVNVWSVERSRYSIFYLVE